MFALRPSAIWRGYSLRRRITGCIHSSATAKGTRWISRCVRASALLRYFKPQSRDSYYLPYRFNGIGWQEFPQELAEFHIRTDVPTDRSYPAGPVEPGGLTDKWLSDFPNLYADMSANSGNNALSRDRDFSQGFVARHQDKLIFGSDCSCVDGKGGSVSQNNNPEASRLAGKCVARATLELSKQLTSPEVFRKITWENGKRLFKVSL